MTTEYYVWDSELFFVYHNEQNFEQIIDSVNGFMGFDFYHSKIAFESRHYFNKNTEISKIKKGKRLMKLAEPANFQNKFILYQHLLHNRKENEYDYNHIQGKWISTTDSLYVMIFDGLTLVDYYDGNYSDQSKIKIESDTLFCWPLQGEDEYKYAIMSLSDTNLTLLYLPYGGLLLFVKNPE